MFLLVDVSALRRLVVLLLLIARISFSVLRPYKLSCPVSDLLELLLSRLLRLEFFFLRILLTALLLSIELC